MSYNIHAEPVGHGNTPAAWATVFVMIFGGIVSSVGFCIPSTLVFWSGIVIMALGLVVGWAMKKAGYGVNGHKLGPKSAHE